MPKRPLTHRFRFQLILNLFYKFARSSPSALFCARKQTHKKGETLKKSSTSLATKVEFYAFTSNGKSNQVQLRRQQCSTRTERMEIFPSACGGALFFPLGLKSFKSTRERSVVALCSGCRNFLCELV